MILLLCFVCATLLLCGLALRARRRCGGEAGPPPPGGATSESSRWRRAGARLRPDNEERLEALRLRLARAGLGGDAALDRHLAARMLVAALSVGAGAAAVVIASSGGDALGALLWACLAAGVALVGPGLWLDGRTRRRRALVAAALPPTLDLIVTCIDAGLALEQALDRVSARARAGDGALADELRITLGEMRAGLPVAAAFRRFAARSDLEEVSTLATVVVQAAALGSNIGDVLRAHAAGMRRHRMMALEESAGKANAKLTLPVTLCLLPAVLALLLGPAALAVLRSL